VNDERFEHLRTPVPGPRSLALQTLLERYESRGVTYLAPHYPVFWESAHGATVTDVDGNRYLDLTSAFGVANIGHTNPTVTAAIMQQATHLIHGMGDVHPTEVRARLLEVLARITPGNLQKTYLAAGGAEAIEFARKTAFLATGKPHTLAYTGAYHGLSLGTLDVIGIAKFRDPFAALLDARTTFLPFPNAATRARCRSEHRRDLARTDSRPRRCYRSPQRLLARTARALRRARRVADSR